MKISVVKFRNTYRKKIKERLKRLIQILNSRWHATKYDTAALSDIPTRNIINMHLYALISIRMWLYVGIGISGIAIDVFTF